MRFKLTIYKNFEDIKNKIQTEDYPEDLLFYSLYKKIKGYAPRPSTQNYYKKVNSIENLILLETEGWVSYEEDMIEISKEFFTLYFCLMIQDSCCRNMGYYCFHNGKISGGKAQIIYPEIKEEDFNDEDI